MVADPRTKRIAGLQRLVTLQRQLQKLAEADLAQANREREDVRIAIENLVAAMSGMSATHRLFPHLYARQLSTLKARDQVLVGQIELHKARINTERTRGDRVGDRLDKANQDSERHFDDEALFDMLDGVNKTDG
ncbi:MAG: hypothetical protein NXI27_18095 [Alphaproteobacteria bacterium]|nr:hypothetical protein [Alphaproteobacteria bacterium]